MAIFRLQVQNITAAPAWFVGCVLVCFLFWRQTSQSHLSEEIRTYSEIVGKYQCSAKQWSRLKPVTLKVLVACCACKCSTCFFQFSENHLINVERKVKTKAKKRLVSGHQEIPFPIWLWAQCLVPYLDSILFQCCRVTGLVYMGLVGDWLSLGFLWLMSLWCLKTQTRNSR